VKFYVELADYKSGSNAQIKHKDSFLTTENASSIINPGIAKQKLYAVRTKEIQWTWIFDSPWTQTEN